MRGGNTGQNTLPTLLIATLLSWQLGIHLPDVFIIKSRSVPLPPVLPPEVQAVLERLNWF